MGLPFHPTHVNRQNQHDRRHGYADLLRYPQRYKVHWRLWNGGTTRLLLWGDPGYVRRFAETAHLYGGDSFEVNEMLATWMLGEPHDTQPLVLLNPKYRYYDYEFERYWHYYQVWGRLSYNPDTPAEVWAREFDRRFGPQAGPAMMRSLHLASQILPRIVAASYRYQLFPTTRGWAEIMRIDDLPRYADAEGSDVQQFMNMRDQARSTMKGTDTAMRRPDETSRWFMQISNQVLQGVAEAEQSIGSSRSKEFISTVTDLKILAALASYHSHRLEAGVCYNLYELTGDLFSFHDAIKEESLAVGAWEQGRAGTVPAGGPDNPIVMAITDDDQPPQADLERIQTAEPGKDVQVAAKVWDPSGVKWARLRYRHVTQFEDYKIEEMQYDPRTGLWSATIPGEFIVPQWDLMYFIEVVDTWGNGKMYPDMEVETPYVIVQLER